MQRSYMCQKNVVLCLIYLSREHPAFLYVERAHPLQALDQGLHLHLASCLCQLVRSVLISCLMKSSR